MIISSCNTSIGLVHLAAGSAVAMPSALATVSDTTTVNLSAQATPEEQTTQFAWSTVKVIQETSDSPKALLFKGESFQPFPDPDQREAHQLTLTDIAEEVDADHDYTTYDASQEGNGPNGETNYKYTYHPPPA